MEESNRQIRIELSIALLAVGIPLMLFGLDKLGVVTLPFALSYFLVGGIVTIIGIVFLIREGLEKRASLKKKG